MHILCKSWMANSSEIRSKVRSVNFWLIFSEKIAKQILYHDIKLSCCDFGCNKISKPCSSDGDDSVENKHQYNTKKKSIQASKQSSNLLYPYFSGVSFYYDHVVMSNCYPFRKAKRQGPIFDPRVSHGRFRPPRQPRIPVHRFPVRQDDKTTFVTSRRNVGNCASPDPTLAGDVW